MSTIQYTGLKVSKHGDGTIFLQIPTRNQSFNLQITKFNLLSHIQLIRVLCEKKQRAYSVIILIIHQILVIFYTPEQPG